MHVGIMAAETQVAIVEGRCKHVTINLIQLVYGLAIGCIKKIPKES